jgi:hypothetical protein
MSKETSLILTGMEVDMMEDALGSHLDLVLSLAATDEVTVDEAKTAWVAWADKFDSWVAARAAARDGVDESKAAQAAQDAMYAFNKVWSRSDRSYGYEE